MQRKKRVGGVGVAFLVGLVAVAVHAESITTAVGTGIATSDSDKLANNFPGDDIDASTATVDLPRGLALDASGNLYIADTGNRMIRKVSVTTNLITRVAGNGDAAFSTGKGDGGFALAAALIDPRAVAVDASGNIFIAEFSSNRVRRVDHSTGIINTYAGRDRITSDTSTTTGDGGVSTSALLFQPTGLATDAAGNLYIAEQAGNRIRFVNASTLLISTVAGTGTAGYSGDGAAATSATLRAPGGVAIHPTTGRLYVADTNNHCIRMVNGSGNISTVAGTTVAGFSGDGGAATSAQLNRPRRIAFDTTGNLFIADYANHRIRRVDPSGNISTVAGGGTTGDDNPATSAVIMRPTDVAVVSTTNFFIAEPAAYRIREVTADIASASDLDDADGDGFSDDIEDAAGTTEADAASTPFGGAAALADVYTLEKMNIKFSRTSNAGDVISFTAVLTIDSSTSLASQNLIFDIGGSVHGFTSDADGKFTGDTVNDRLKARINRSGNRAIFDGLFRRGAFLADLRDEGFSSSLPGLTNLPVRVQMLFDGTIYAENASIWFSNGRGKGGGTAFVD